VPVVHETSGVRVPFGVRQRPVPVFFPAFPSPDVSASVVTVRATAFTVQQTVAKGTFFNVTVCTRARAFFQRSVHKVTFFDVTVCTVPLAVYQTAIVKDTLTDVPVFKHPPARTFTDPHKTAERRSIESEEERPHETLTVSHGQFTDNHSFNVVFPCHYTVEYVHCFFLKNRYELRIVLVRFNTLEHAPIEQNALRVL
jgi:hypothetical protein